MAQNVKEVEVKLTKEWTNAIDKAFEAEKKDIKVDGFRKGAVPKDIYLKKFGIESLYDKAINVVMDEAYKKAMEESKVVPVIQPSVDITGISDTNIIFKFKFVSKPEVTLGKYKKLGLKKEKASVSKEELEKEIEALKLRFAEAVVKKGKVENGDTAVIDFKGFVDNEELEGGSGNDFPLEIGSNSFIPGFEEKLIGSKAGDNLTLDLKFPENYVEHLKNKDVTFEVLVKEVTTKKLPELGIEFYKDLGYEDISTEEEFKTKVKESIKNSKESEINNKFIDLCLEEACKNMKVEINDEIVHEEIHRMIHQYEDQLKMQGMDLNTYFQMTGTTQEDLDKQMKPEALKRVKYRYLLEEVAKLENFEFTDKEVDKKIEELATNYGITPEELIKAYGDKEVIKYDMKMHKAIETLTEE